MEDLFREILAPSPAVQTTSLPLDSTSSVLFQAQSYESSESASPAESALITEGMDWDSVEGMQRLLGMLPNVAQSDANVDSVDFPSALDLELEGTWDLENMSSTSIGVY